MRTAGKKILSLALAVLLALGGTLPQTVFAVSESGGGTIIAFEPLVDSVANRTVPPGTSLEDLELPATLTATMEMPEPETPTDSGEPSPTTEPEQVDIPVLTWTAQPDYDGGTAGVYVFAPTLQEGNTLAKNATVPTIEVTVADGKPTEKKAPTVAIAIDPDGPLYLPEGQPVTNAELLAGVSAADENGEAVAVTVQDTDWLDMETPAHKDDFSAYTITYAAEHPVSGETFTAMREAYVTMGIMPLDGTWGDGGIIDLSALPSGDASSADLNTPWSWDSTTKKLTLTGPGPYIIEGDADGTACIVVNTSQDVELVINGNITAPHSASNFGDAALTISGNENVFITGTGRLTGGTSTTFPGHGIYAQSASGNLSLAGSLQITGGSTLAGYAGIDTNKDVYIAGDIVVRGGDGVVVSPGTGGTSGVGIRAGNIFVSGKLQVYGGNDGMFGGAAVGLNSSSSKVHLTDPTAAVTLNNGNKAGATSLNFENQCADTTWDIDPSAIDGGGTVNDQNITVKVPAHPDSLVIRLATTIEPGITMNPATATVDMATAQDNAIVSTASATNFTGSPIEYSIDSGTLPLGLSLDASTGEISVATATDLVQTPATTVTIKAEYNTESATAPVTITVQGAPAPGTIPVTSITVSGTGSATSITTKSGTLQMLADVLPTNASNASVTWSVAPGTGGATIIPSGLLTATANGTVTVTASANDGSGVTGTLVIAISGQGGSTTPSHNDNDSTTRNKSITVIPPDQPNMPTVAKREVSGKVENKVLTMSITEQMTREAIVAAEKSAKDANKTANGIAVEFAVTGSGDYESLVVNFDAGAIDRLNAAGVKYVKIGSALIDISLDAKAIAEIDKQSTGTVTLSAMREEKLSNPAKAAIGHRPAFDITLKDSKGTAITDLKGGTATIGIAYATKNNGTGSLYAVYVKPNGQIEWLQNSSYTGGRLLFGTGHFSIYGVGYKTPATAFTDIKGHWARENMEFAASRGLLTGTSATTFSPNTAITRGMFITVLGRLSEQDMSSYTVSSFADVKSGSYYLPYIEWGVKNKIVSGVGGSKFEPDRAITREEMAVMLYNYTKATGYTLPVSVEKITFTDDGSISLWAKDAVKALQQAGIVSGVGGGKFNPKGTATRAEAATILRNLVERIIDESTARGWSRNDAGQWMHFNWKGERTIGWLSVTGTDIMYYLDANGVMVSGKWLQIGGKWYYFYVDGSLARSTKIGEYEVDETGARKTK